MKFTEQEKQNLFNNGTFCMLPWITINSTPTGAAIPCSIAGLKSNTDIIGNINDSSLMELVNSKKMKELRRNMLDGVKNTLCSTCYRHEEQGIKSCRQSSNVEYEKYFDETLSSTNEIGELENFKMRYFDLRLSNICNMKCRTCSSHFSSQWENEDAKQGKKIYYNIGKESRSNYVTEILTHIPHMDTAYFAGGEPLITEEHYIMLEEMIRLGKTDINLRYHTNMSNLKYKDKDLLDLWSHFTQKIEIYASLDDYGKRAEYIRSGTVWEQVEENFRKVKSIPYVRMNINSVLSIFNFVTFSEFYHYLLDNKLYNPEDDTYIIYNMINPQHINAHVLPTHLKTIGINGLNSVITRMKDSGFHKFHLQQLIDCNRWVMTDNTWEMHKEEFQKETQRLDSLRGEKFVEVFPHLAELMQ